MRKKYAFGIKGIPRDETNWLEVSCDFPCTSFAIPLYRATADPAISPAGSKFEGSQKAGEIPLDASGALYSHVFGTNASAFELFVVERKIMGPCWLNIEAPTVKDPKTAGVSCLIASPSLSSFGADLLYLSQVSWTKLEVTVGKDNVNIFAQDDASAPKANPPLTIMSLSARTVVHLNENKREMVCASARVWTDSEFEPPFSRSEVKLTLDRPSSSLAADLDDPKPLEKIPSSVTTLVRNLFTPFPAGFEALARGANPGSRNSIIPFKDEKTMLAQLLGGLDCSPLSC